MKKVKMVLLYGALVGLLLGFVTWRVQTPPPAVPLTGILVDRSGSVPNPCSAMAGLVERQVTLSPAELAIFATGDENNAHEPVLLSSSPVPTRQRLIKGKRRLAQEEQAFIRQLQALCNQQPAGHMSPIYLGIHHAVAHLRASGQVERRLLVISDLRENFDRRVRKALAQPLGTKTRLPEPIDNAGITIEVCGYAQTHDKQLLQTERLIEVWQRLFTDPARASFRPFCVPAEGR
jgi:hypothetical protein